MDAWIEIKPSAVSKKKGLVASYMDVWIEIEEDFLSFNFPERRILNGCAD